MAVGHLGTLHTSASHGSSFPFFCKFHLKISIFYSPQSVRASSLCQQALKLMPFFKKIEPCLEKDDPMSCVNSEDLDHLELLPSSIYGFFWHRQSRDFEKSRNRKAKILIGLRNAQTDHYLRFSHKP